MFSINYLFFISIGSHVRLFRVAQKTKLLQRSSLQSKLNMKHLIHRTSYRPYKSRTRRDWTPYQEAKKQIPISIQILGRSANSNKSTDPQSAPLYDWLSCLVRRQMIKMQPGLH